MKVCGLCIEKDTFMVLDIAFSGFNWRMTPGIVHLVHKSLLLDIKIKLVSCYGYFTLYVFYTVQRILCICPNAVT